MKPYDRKHTAKCPFCEYFDEAEGCTYNSEAEYTCVFEEEMAVAEMDRYFRRVSRDVAGI